MYQNPPRYVPGPPQVVRGRRRPPFPVLLLAPFVLFALLFFGGSYAIAPEPDVEVQPGVAVTEAGGRTVLLAPYRRDGVRGMVQMMTQDLFQVRLAALDVATGDVLWDIQLADELAWEASVVAAGHRYAYLTTPAGPVVVALSDGTVVARGAGVEGLGDRFLATPAAYAYDAAGRRVLALTSAGAVLAIPLDQSVATPVDAATAAAWSARLSAEQHATATAEVAAAEAVLAGSRERVALRDLPVDGLGQELVRITADGRLVPVGGTAFHAAHLVVADGVAAGGTGRVLVGHERSVNDDRNALSLVSLTNGQVIGALDLVHSPERAVVGPDGTTVVAARDVLAVVRADGRLTRADIGATDFFGSPS
jgi:hypothetical protein